VEAYERYTQDIGGSPRGKSTGAFFDFDGTIIASHSVMDMFIERLKSGEIKSQEIFDLGAMIPRYLLKQDNFTDSIAASIRNLAGVPEEKLLELGDRVARERLGAEVYPEMRAMIRAHQKKGHTVAIVSSATRYQVAPLARSLGIEHILCTELEVVDDHFTGEMDGEPCYADNKVTAVRKFARLHRVNIGKSFFYSNGAEDVALLETVGHPVVINPDSKLAKIARRNGWRDVRLESRGFVGVGDVARTLLTFGTALPILAASLPFRAIGVGERDATNFSLNAWTSIAPLIARLKLIVEGPEHLWSHRPAVFIFNHRSAIDLLIAARLLREDAVGIAKKEVKRQPLIGPALSYAGAVFIDRENVRDPKTALQPAVDALDEGRSVVIAPEGTRSRNGRLGEFKRGAFHMARQAGVPIVPIVIHNAEDALPGTSMVLRPAEVKVTVLPPIPTDNWTLRDVSPQTRRIRSLYLDCLGEADEGDPGTST
jgi:putative phosphoserine phosphatase/1-acylglycerol-3-phosphate O-acyltransferase